MQSGFQHPAPRPAVTSVPAENGHGRGFAPAVFRNRPLSAELWNRRRREPVRMGLFVAERRTRRQARDREVEPRSWAPGQHSAPVGTDGLTDLARGRPLETV